MGWGLLYTFAAGGSGRVLAEQPAPLQAAGGELEGPCLDPLESEPKSFLRDFSDVLPTSSFVVVQSLQV